MLHLLTTLKYHSAETGECRLCKCRFDSLCIIGESSASEGHPGVGAGADAGEGHPGAGGAQGRKQWPGPRLSSLIPSPDPEMFKALTFQSQPKMALCC